MCVHRLRPGQPGSHKLTGFANDHRARHMANVVKIVSSRLEYWAIRFKTQGVLKDTDEKNLIAGMNQQLQLTPRIPIEIATQLGSCVQGASFLKNTTKAMLNDMIDSKIAHVEKPETVVGRVKIKMRTIEFYQSRKCWASYASDEPDDMKIFRMAFTMAAVGMHPKTVDEITFAEAASLALQEPEERSPQLPILP